MSSAYSLSGPIGIFDSGYGGLTILKDLIEKLPSYDFVYIGDNARNPYGPRSFEVVYRYTLEAVERLFEMGCPLAVIACNTASAKALRSIQQNDLQRLDASRRVLGVIRPSVEAVGLLTKTGHVGVLATQGTVASESYPLEIQKLFPDIVVTQEACPMWVPLVEYNEFNNEGADYFVQKNIASLLAKNPKIDLVILGCTHYPLLLDKISKYLPKEIKLVNQGQVIAASLSDYLHRHPEIESRLTRNSSVKYFSTEASQAFEQQGSQFMSKPIHASHIELSTVWSGGLVT
jgi:glutamate racemase